MIVTVLKARFYKCSTSKRWSMFFVCAGRVGNIHRSVIRPSAIRKINSPCLVNITSFALSLVE